MDYCEIGYQVRSDAGLELMPTYTGDFEECRHRGETSRNSRG